MSGHNLELKYFTAIFIYFRFPINKASKTNQQFFSEILVRFSGLNFSANN